MIHEPVPKKKVQGVYKAWVYKSDDGKLENRRYELITILAVDWNEATRKATAYTKFLNHGGIASIQFDEDVTVP
jgi:hypothetical protein